MKLIIALVVQLVRTWCKRAYLHWRLFWIKLRERKQRRQIQKMYNQLLSVDPSIAETDPELVKSVLEVVEFDPTVHLRSGKKVVRRTRTVRATICGKKVENPFLQTAILFSLVMLVVALSPLLVPLHFILRCAGRNGILRPQPEPKTFHIALDKEAFQKVA